MSLTTRNPSPERPKGAPINKAARCESAQESAQVKDIHCSQSFIGSLERLSKVKKKGV